MLLFPHELEDFFWQEIGEYHLVTPLPSKLVFSLRENKFSSAIIKENQVKCLGLPVSFLKEETQPLLYRSVIDEKVNFRSPRSLGILFGEEIETPNISVLQDPNLFYDHTVILKKDGGIWLLDNLIYLSNGELESLEEIQAVAEYFGLQLAKHDFPYTK